MVLRLLESSRDEAVALSDSDDLLGELRSRRGVHRQLSVSQPGDACERQADAVAARVVQRAPGVPVFGTGSPVAAVRRQTAAGAAGPVARQAGPDRAAPGGQAVVESVLAETSGGQPLDAGVQEQIQPHLGVDLSGVRVKQTPETDAAARVLGARAFTVGSTIYLAARESPTDVELMAHEATHVAQQSAGPAAVAPMVMRDVSVTDVVPDFILDGVRSAISAIPGYTLLTFIIGTDPLTDQPVRPSREELVEKLLTYGPFGQAVAPVLQAVDVLGDVFAFVTEGLAANNLTLDRIGRDIESAWGELSVTEGIDGNVAIVRRYVDAILADVGAFVRSIVDRIIEMVRAVVAEVAEPVLQRPEIRPVWELAKKVLHYDPLRGQPVSAPTVEILGDFLRLIGQEQRLAQMTERGTLQQTADWLDTQFATFASIVNDVSALFAEAWAAISPQNLPNLLDTLPPLADRAIGLVRRIADFVTTVIGKVLELVKQALLGWLSEHAHRLPGFHLLTVILGRNPFTGEAVPRTAENLIRGFITLMPGGDATYAQLAESGVIAEAAGRIESEMARLGISWELITNTFLGIWNTLSLDDLLAPIAAFERILAQFGEPLGRIIEFVTVVIQVVITLILKLMNFPSDLVGSIISNAMQAIDDIQRDPVAFILNMLQALKGGFLAFFDNIASYLLQGLTAWLFRGLSAIGITAPPDLSLGSILNLVLQVLGVTIDNLWQKLGRLLGEERVAMIRGAIDRLTGAWAFIRDVQQEGISAVWRYLVDKLSSLWDTLLGMARDWIMGEIVERVITKLVSMLDPTGIMAVVNSFIAFFNAIQSAIEYLRDILQIVNEYVTTFAAVAAGNIAPGAEKIKEGLGHAVPIAIGFLANQVGIGNVPEKVVEIIGQLRQLIDEALDWLLEQAVNLGQAALSALGFGGPAQDPAAAPADPNAPSPADHPAFARHAADQLAAAVRDDESPLEAARRYAATNEPTLSSQLEQGIGLRFVLPDSTTDLADGDLDFSVVIAPNTTTHTASVAVTADPDCSAPGLGRIGTHGSKPSSLRDGPKVHWLESEHVIPFATGKRLWQLLRFVVPGRSGHEDRGQTTIMIYEGAARIKTPADNDMSDEFNAILQRNRVEEQLTDARRSAATGNTESITFARNLMSLVMAQLREAKIDAVRRTVQAIDEENRSKEAGHTKENGERRAVPPAREAPLPTEADIMAAATTQYDNIVDLVTDAMEDVNVLSGSS